MGQRKKFSYNVFGIVDVSLVRELINKIEEIPKDIKAEIVLRVNSQGGSVPVALAFAEYLRSLPHHVVSYNMAHCDSAAILVFSAAQERVVMGSSSFLFHPPCVHLNGKFTIHELTIELKRLKKDAKSMVEFLSKTLQLDREQLIALIERGEHIISAQQALRIGVATEIGH